MRKINIPGVLISLTAFTVLALPAYSTAATKTEDAPSAQIDDPFIVGVVKEIIREEKERIRQLLDECEDELCRRKVRCLNPRFK